MLKISEEDLANLRSLLLNPKYRSALKKIIEYEEWHQSRAPGITPYWRWDDVGVHWSIVNDLITSGIVYSTGGRRKLCLLRNRELVSQVLKETEEYTKSIGETCWREPAVPSDFLDIVEGYDDLKKFITKALTLDEPFHILLVGEPGTAKSLILMEIERLPGAKLITAGTSSKVGIRDLLLEEEPRYLLIDEIDKIGDPNDLSILLTLMESQRVVVAKHGMRVDKKVSCSVIAAANSTKKLPRELLDRFDVYYLKSYTKDEYVRVVSNYLVKRRGTDPELARYIAEKVGGYTSSVREAVRVAKICKSREEVDEFLRVKFKYGNGNGGDLHSSTHKF